MKEEKHKILVPVDFTEASDCAIRNAIVFSKIIRHTLCLLHVIEKPLIQIGTKFNNKLIEEGTITRLQKIAKDIKEKHKLDVEIIAKLGNIFDTINDVAFEIGASFVIMGTHGVKGLQYLTGSKALKVIYNSKIPFIVVQKDSPCSQKFDDIVLPVDFTRETKQKVYWAIFIAKKFNSTIHIIYPSETIESYAKRINKNLTYTKKLFDANDVMYTVKESNKRGGNIVKETIRYADEIRANLIMIMTDPLRGTGEFLLRPEDQDIITNPSRIPVMCINPREDAYISATVRPF